MKYYLRFGDIPTSGLSNIWLNDQIIGQELGVPVYDAVLMTDGWHVILPKPITHKVRLLRGNTGGNLSENL